MQNLCQGFEQFSEHYILNPVINIFLSQHLQCTYIVKTSFITKLPDILHIEKTNYMNLFARKINEAETRNKLATSRVLSEAWLE